MKRNPEQEAAVLHDKGPLLIIAGAGTGKTTVITQKIKYLIEVKKVHPQEIFATTFTEKTAAEILERLDTVMPLGYLPPWIGTFHSLCDRLLRQEGLEIGLDPSFTIMTPTDQWIFIKEHLYELPLSYYRPLGNPGKFINALGSFFSRLQDEDVSKAEFQKLVTNKLTQAVNADSQIEAERIQELFMAYTAYSDLKIKHSVFDFGDLITQTLHLLRSRPNIAAKLRRQFRYILVDEFQDTNYAQFMLMQLLAPPKTGSNLIVVGDDDQSIYKFRGASVANILAFKEIYQEASEVILNRNYRSSQPILDSAYQVIQHNNPDRLETKLQIDKHLIASISNADNPPELNEFSTEANEVEWLADTVQKLIKKDNILPQEIAILARSNAQLEPYVNALRSRQIPYQLVANRGLFDQPEVKQLLHFLEIIIDPENSTLLFQLFSSKPFNVSPEQLFKFLEKSRQNASSLWVELMAAEDESIKKALSLITKYQAIAPTMPVGQLLHQFLIETEYLKPYLKEETTENILQLKNITLLFEKIQRFENASKENSLVHFIEALRLWIDSGDNPGQAEIEDIDCVSLMTIHAAKGLEFTAVFIPSLIAGRFPSINRRDPITMPAELIKEELPTGDAHLEEERRLFYVALTRAKTHLYLSFATDYGGVRKRKMSGFAAETNLPITVRTSTSTPVLPNAQEMGFNAIQYKFNLKHVSYSQIDTFKTCPLKYKYRYVLRLPSKPHHSLTYGRSIHNTLYNFHRLKLQGKVVSEDELIALFQEHFEPIGYENKIQKEKRYAEGIEELRRYYHTHKNIGGTPELLEQEFNLKIAGVLLKGKIDRIDKTPQGYEIIDYKTGSPKNQKDVDKDEQLSIYSLAAKEVLNLDIKIASLYFMQTAEKVSTTRTPAHLAKAKVSLENKINEIKTSTFPHKADERTCSFCEFKKICIYSKAK